MDEFAFFFDDRQIIEEVHLIEPPRRRAQVLLFPRPIRTTLPKHQPPIIATYFSFAVWPGAP